MADKFGGIPVEEGGRDKFGGVAVMDHPAEKPGALERFGHGFYETTAGPVLNTIAHPLEAAKGLINLPKLEEIAEHLKKGDYGKAALSIVNYGMQNPAQRMGQGMVDDVWKDASEGNLAGAGGRIAGDALMLAGPKLGEMAAGSRAGTAVGAGLKAAAPDVMTGGAMIAGGEALAQVPGMSFPARIAMGYPGARQVGAGIKKGLAAGRASLKETAAARNAAIQEAKLAAEAEKIPPDVMSELTRDTGPPASTPRTMADFLDANGVTLDRAMSMSETERAALQAKFKEWQASSPGESVQNPQGQPIPDPRPGWESEAAVERLRADQAARAQTGPIPIQAQRLLGPGPANVMQMPQAPDGSFVRAVPAQYPTKPTPGMPAQEAATLADLAAPPEAPPEPKAMAAAAGTSTLADLMDSVPQATRKPMAAANYRAVKEGNAAPETAGATFEAAGRANKVENLANALDEAGVNYEQMSAKQKSLPEGRWVDYVSALAREVGEHNFSATSVDALMVNMRRLATKRPQ